MDWSPVTVVIAFVAIALQLLQGLSLLLKTNRAPHVLWFGVLTILIGILGIVAFALFYSGDLVISPEFGLAMVQGPVGRAGLGVLLVGLAIAAGLAWHVGRTTVGLKPHLGWLIGIGCIVGLWSISGLANALNPDDPDLIRVYSFDLWSAPLLIWIALSLLESVLAILRVGSGQARLWLAMLVTIGISSFGLARFGFSISDPSAVMWAVPLGIALAVAILLAIVGVRKARAAWTRWIGALRAEERNQGQTIQFIETQRLKLLSKVTVRQSILLLALAGLVTSLGIVFDGLTDLENNLALLGFIISWTILSVVIGQGLIYQVLHDLRNGKFLDPESLWRKDWQALRTRFSAVIAQPIKWLRWFLSPGSIPAVLVRALIIVVILIAVSEIPNSGKTLILPFRVLNVDNQSALGEIVSDRLLMELSLLNQQLAPDIIIPSEILDKGQRLHLAAESVGANSGVLDTVLAKSDDLEVGGVKVPLSVLVAPIQGPVRQLLRVRVISGAVQVDQDNYILEANSNDGEGWVIKYPLARSFTLTITPTLATSQPPLSTGQSQTRTLNVNIKPADGKSTSIAFPLVVGGKFSPCLSAGAITAQVSPGGTITLPLTLTLQSPLTVDVVPATGVTIPSSASAPLSATVSVESSLQFSGLKQDYALTLALKQELNQAVATTPTEAFTNLPKQLAFKIISGSSEAKLSKTWEAFQPFQLGLQEMNRANLGDYDALPLAINDFKEAICQDPSFALAHYRLGLALEADRQPKAALIALRASLLADPQFVPSYNALANHLYNYSSFYSATGAVAPVASSEPDDRRQQEVKEARYWWQRVLLSPPETVSPAELASAYFGLCQEAYLEDHAYPLAFFYCKRAQGEYARLSTSLRADPRTRQAEEYTLDVLGVIFYQPDPNASSVPADGWQCDIDGATNGKLFNGIRSSAALGYFQRALAFDPNNSVLLCNAANAAWVLGNKKPMLDLAKSAAAHISLADIFLRRAKDLAFARDPSSATYFRRALQEYQSATATEIFPVDLNALNGYAYTYWTWRLLSAGAEPPDGPDQKMGEMAEKFARQVATQAKDNVTREYQLIYRSTLGEVLNGLGRPKEAIQELEPLFTDNLIYSHPLFDEIRWDMAQAYLCAASDPQSPEFHAKWLSQAKGLLNQIQENEKLREFQPYTQANELGSPLAEICRMNGKKP